MSDCLDNNDARFDDSCALADSDSSSEGMYF